MRDIATKTDLTTTLAAAEFNSDQNELENIVTSTGQTLDASSGPDTDLNMLGKAAAIYSSDNGFYQDGGSANSYSLTRTDSLQSPPSYFDGQQAVFKAANSNTGASTINIASVGSKPITTKDGTALSGGEITTGSYIIVRYNLSGDRFELVNTSPVFVREIITSSTAWNVPDGVGSAWFTVAGAGGGGGGGSVNAAGSSAGTSGGNTTVVYSTITLTSAGGGAGSDVGDYTTPGPSVPTAVHGAGSIVGSVANGAILSGKGAAGGIGGAGQSGLVTVGGTGGTGGTGGLVYAKVSLSPSTSATVTIGAGGTGGAGVGAPVANNDGENGEDGYVIVEYFV